MKQIVEASSNRQRRYRLWTMKSIAMLLIPVLFLGSAEFVLRVVGFGYPTSYFIPTEIDGKEYLVTNEKFTYRFFPPEIARPTLPIRLTREKPDGAYRIFIFGASAALGDPDPNYGFGQYLEVLLEEQYPEVDFEIICVALTAINSHVVLPIARQCAGLDGDLWLVYLGNNEMVGPFGPGTIFGRQAPGVGFVRFALAVKSTRLGQFLGLLTSRFGNDSDSPAKWTGIQMFKENQLSASDAGRIQAYANFEANLQSILKAGQDAGVPVVLSTVGVNLRDCSPFTSLHRVDLDESASLAWRDHFEEGQAHEKSGDYAAAMEQYNQALAIDPAYAEVYFRVGRCLQALGQPEKALKAFEKARDFDALAVRADTRINETIKAVAGSAKENVILVDAAKSLAGISLYGIPGAKLFFEHVHFTFEGNYKLARIFADRVADILKPEIHKHELDKWLDFNVCNNRVALTHWDQRRIWLEILERVTGPPHSAQSCNSDNKAYIRAQLRQLEAYNVIETQWRDRQLYEAALSATPDDTLLIGNFAQFLEASGSREDAIALAQKNCLLVPDHPWPHYYLGAILLQEGRLDEAKKSLEQAIRLRSEFVHAKEALKALERKERARR